MEIRSINFFVVIIMALPILISCQKGVSENQSLDPILDTTSNDTVTTPKDSVTVFKIHMSAKGNDANDGSELNKAVKTLNKVQDILKKINPQTDIEVLIKNGDIFYGDEVRWTYVNGKKISFRATDLSDLNRPVFYGIKNENWFTLNFRQGKNTYLSFRHLRIEHYNCAIYFWGNQDDPSNGWNGGNFISDCYFSNIGNKFSGLNEMAYGAVRLVNSRNNKIVNCHFVNLDNKKKEELSHLHGVYFAHFSSENTVYSCRFEKICGDPVRTRNRASNNLFEENSFKQTGKYAFYSDWYCSKELTSCNTCDCIKLYSECPSFGNYFKNNKCDKGFNGSKIHLFQLFGIDSYCGTLPAPRLRTLGNVNL